MADRVEGVGKVEEQNRVAVCHGFGGQRPHGVDAYFVPTFKDA